MTRFGSERLTGAGPRSQRGLESPGAEVGRCSLKDEGDRQGDKHGPLSTWGSSIFVRFLFYSHFSSAPGPSSFRRFFGLSSSAFLPVQGRRQKDGCFLFVCFWRFLASVGTSTLWIHISGLRRGFRSAAPG